ncbi:lysophospholipid acyltransferase family protein [Oceanirhabdus sp. W0125-5]|uniref:lysophospholipid acyltransferase family protein n=1 Tax=Oceanirhabdus sp. W0125-5 TaxID=2999116 RepID=UPI0022F2C96C|nr:lysophospholipid acyltransferase family protein [Oceanirhabdus sp. W0125-5]WBW98522.1 lysophospholipid acyltransferase family protein [Oceanirhabdus sp. W0125-5]
MISPRMAKFMNYIPDSILVPIAKKLVNRYIKKYANIKINGEENLKDINGPVIFVCNHLSNADGLILNKLLKYNDPTFIAGRKLYKDFTTNLGMKIVKTVSITPNSADKDAMKKIIQILRNGNNIMMFPEGTRSRVGSLIKGKSGITILSRMGKASIVPIGMSGTEKLMPINKEGKMNAEKFYHSDVNINIGKQFKVPDRLKGEDKKEYEDRATDFIMYEIAKLLPKEYRGVYDKI